MLRLKANKTALYKLVADYVDNLPPMRRGQSSLNTRAHRTTP